MVAAFEALSESPVPPPPDPPLSDLPNLDPPGGQGTFRVGSAGVVVRLGAADPMKVTHLVAPTLLDAIMAGDDDARSVGTDLAGLLTLRGWLGDDDLAAEFHRVLGGGRLGSGPGYGDMQALIDEVDDDRVAERLAALRALRRTRGDPRGIEVLPSGHVGEHAHPRSGRVHA